MATCFGCGQIVLSTGARNENHSIRPEKEDIGRDATGTRREAETGLQVERMTCDDITCQRRNVCTSERKQDENERGGPCYWYLKDEEITHLRNI